MVRSAQASVAPACGAPPAVQGTVYAIMMAAFAAVAVQLVILGWSGRPQIALAATEPVATSFSRPDIVDRNGRLLATDLEVPSIYADPALVLDRDELVEKLAVILPDIDQDALRAELSDRGRRFVWVRRGVAPAIAQKVHDLGIPGLGFRAELKRAYPAASLAGHVLGTVNIDNKGMTGVERYIDDKAGSDPIHSARLSTRPPVRLSLDLGVQHALEDELDTAMRRYHAEGAAGLVLDIRTGEVLASASLPRVEPGLAKPASDRRFNDRIWGGSYELGSVFKALTVAMAFDEGLAKPTTMIDVREPLVAGGHRIEDMHVSERPLSVAEIFTHSSNVGAGMLALQAGGERMRKFLAKLGLLDRITTEAGTVSAPQLPERWDGVELITTSYGHGIAVAPIQFAAAAATILNGGVRISPTYLKVADGGPQIGKAVVTRETTRQLAQLFRLNVMGADGTGRRADVPGFRVGGKTGTADRAENGGYDRHSVLSSFLGAFPMDDPQYLTFVLLFEPEAVEDSGGQRTASSNAAPVTGRLISRIALQLGVRPLDAAPTQ